MPTPSPKPYITIVVPTISARADWLEKCLLSYARTTVETKVQLVVIHDRDTCAVAWNEGIARAEAPLIHLTADDIEAHPGWWQAAERSVYMSQTPAAKILNTDGSLQSCGGEHLTPNGTEVEIARIPFGRREWFEDIGPFPEDMHYFTDNWWSWAVHRVCGVPSVVNQDYLFTHHLAPERREMADERLHSDGMKFKKRTRR
jgi:hypothetical protein